MSHALRRPRQLAMLLSLALLCLLLPAAPARAAASVASQQALDLAITAGEPDIRVTGSFSLTQNTHIPAGSSFTVESGVTLTTARYDFRTYGPATINGTLVADGSAQFYGPTTLNGVLRCPSSASVYNAFTVAGGGSLSIAGGLSVVGSSATLRNNGDIAVTGNLSLHGCAFENSGSFSSSGVFRCSLNASFVNTGSFTSTGLIICDRSAQLTLTSRPGGSGLIFDMGAAYAGHAPYFVRFDVDPGACYFNTWYSTQNLRVGHMDATFDPLAVDHVGVYPVVGSVFTGWYLDAARTQPYPGSITVGAPGPAAAATLYAGYDTGRASLTASPSPVAFRMGAQDAPAPAAQTVILANAGGGDTTVMAIGIPGAHAAAYDLPIAPPALPALVPAGGRFTFTIQPKAGLAPGNYDTTLSVTTRAPDGTFGQLDIPVHYMVHSAMYRIPGPVQHLNATPGDSAVTLSWTAPADSSGSQITHYEISRDGGLTWPDSTQTLSFAYTGLTNDTLYTFAVRAVNVVGPGPANTVSATPAGTQGAAFEALPGDGRITVKWTTSSSLPAGAAFTFTLDGQPAGQASAETRLFGYEGLENGVPYHVDVYYEGVLVFSAIVTPQKTARTHVNDTESAPRGWQQGVVTNVTEFVNVRSGPGTQYDVVGKASLGSGVTLLEWDESGEWAKVMYDGDSKLGWIHGRFLRGQ